MQECRSDHRSWMLNEWEKLVIFINWIPHKSDISTRFSMEMSRMSVREWRAISAWTGAFDDACTSSRLPVDSTGKFAVHIWIDKVVHGMRVGNWHGVVGYGDIQAKGDIQSQSLKTTLGHIEICPKLRYMLIYFKKSALNRLEYKDCRKSIKNHIHIFFKFCFLCLYIRLQSSMAWPHHLYLWSNVSSYAFYIVKDKHLYLNYFVAYLYVKNQVFM